MESIEIKEKAAIANDNFDQLQKPDPALSRLDRLVGEWKIEGYVPQHDETISGRTSFKWLPGGFFLVRRFNINFLGQHVEGMEIIGFDIATRTFTSTLYSNLGGVGIPYKWDIRGNIVMHSTETSHYTGKFSENGNILTGRWEPEDGKADSMNVAYDATMTRLTN